MPRRKKMLGRWKTWTSHDVKLLRTHSKRKTPIKHIARDMRRSEGALRQKAFALGLSLGEFS